MFKEGEVEVCVGVCKGLGCFGMRLLFFIFLRRCVANDSHKDLQR